MCAMQADFRWQQWTSTRGRHALRSRRARVLVGVPIHGISSFREGLVYTFSILLPAKKHALSEIWVGSPNPPGPISHSHHEKNFLPNLCFGAESYRLPTAQAG